MKQAKRILKIEVQRMDDPYPDTSYLGEYSNTPDDEFSIDRAHTLECRINIDRLEDAEDADGKTCTCDGGTLAHGEYRYFNPATTEAFDPAANWYPAHSPTCNAVQGESAAWGCSCHGMTETDKRAYWLRTMRENASKDYDRMESLQRGAWGYIGIGARAEIVIGDVCQTITSGGLWGIESDGEESYLRETEQEQLKELRGILHALGFSKRAIAAAVKAM